MIEQGKNRNQISFFCLEEIIGEENEVRAVDAFIDCLDLEKLGFEIKGKINNGAPAYQCSILKLFKINNFH